ncbi:LCP family protein [Staphylococcus simulans]|uniref:LCP family protein n=1 Tax=Staphylococcus simulans TaxID=1286 RepID=UPI0029026A9D|nr:LCP family protein [Staphylococcus simulans]MDU0419442.1 LCP family protein [Staphylococcus simulans]MDU0466556.1 LCP family protein [Staphylococcus simulans]
MSRKNKKKLSTPVKWLLIIVGILLLIAIIFIGYLAFKLFGLNNSINSPLDREKSDLRNESVKKDGTPISIALFGIDSDEVRKAEGGGERSDSIILLSINPDKKKTVMVSIPRDTRADIVGHDSVEKINHAYAYGGPNMAVKSIEKLMNVPVDHYATMNLDGVEELVDHIGGVKVVSNATFTFKGKNYQKGKAYELDGQDARAFMGSRKENGAGGDFGRQERQQLVLQALVNKLVSVNSITKINGIVDALGDNVKTDLSITELNDLRRNYEPAKKNVEKLQLEGDNQMLDDGLFYFLPDKANKKKIEKIYRNNLGIQ